MRFTTHSAEATRDLGEKMGRCLGPGDLLLVFGELGAGKTTLIQGIARGLGVGDDQYVRSPSFTLVNEYAGKHPVHHMDLYRIDSGAELLELGLEEIFNGPGITLVEWAEKLFAAPGGRLAEEFRIDHYFEIRLTVEDENSRILEVESRLGEAAGHPLFALQ